MKNGGKWRNSLDLCKELMDASTRSRYEKNASEMSERCLENPIHLLWLVIDHSARPCHCHLIVATREYGDYSFETKEFNHHPDFFMDFFPVQGIQSQDPPVLDNQLVPGISLYEGQLTDLTISFCFERQETLYFMLWSKHVITRLPMLAEFGVFLGLKEMLLEGEAT